MEFPLPEDFPRDVPCAFGGLSFTWSVRTPYPTPKGALGFFSAHQMSEEQVKVTANAVPTTAIGHGGASYCRLIVAVNRSDKPVLVEIRYLFEVARR